MVFCEGGGHSYPPRIIINDSQICVSFQFKQIHADLLLWVAGNFEGSSGSGAYFLSFSHTLQLPTFCFIGSGSLLEVAIETVGLSYPNVFCIRSSISQGL